MSVFVYEFVDFDIAMVHANYGNLLKITSYKKINVEKLYYLHNKL